MTTHNLPWGVKILGEQLFVGAIADGSVLGGPGMELERIIYTKDLTGLVTEWREKEIETAHFICKACGLHGLLADCLDEVRRLIIKEDVLQGRAHDRIGTRVVHALEMAGKI